MSNIVDITPQSDGCNSGHNEINYEKSLNFPTNGKQKIAKRGFPRRIFQELSILVLVYFDSNICSHSIIHIIGS